MQITSITSAAEITYATFETADSNLKQRHQQNYLHGWTSVRHGVAISAVAVYLPSLVDRACK